EQTRNAAMAVADFRKPAEAEVLDRLEVGSVILNYVRGPHGAGVAPVETGEPQEQNPRPDAAANLSEDDIVSVGSGDIGAVRVSGDVLPTAHGAMASMSLGSPGRDAALRGLRFGMSRLPRQLQSQFSRDLHVGVLESENRLGVRTTISDKG